MNIRLLVTLLLVTLLIASISEAQDNTPWPTNGNVGIGTTSPSAPVHIFRIQAYRELNLGSIQTGSYPGVLLENLTSGNSVAITENSGFRLYTKASLTANFTSSDLRFTVATGGNVGIGSETPAELLDVRRDANERIGVRINNPSSGTAADSSLQFFDGTTNRFNINVLNSNYANGLQNAVEFFNLVAGPIRFGTSDGATIDERDRITANGNVGVGTANPIAKLDVHGNIHVSGSINAKYRDVAEWVATDDVLPAGTLVSIDGHDDDHVVRSRGAYDTTVAGVVSPQPGISLGEAGLGKALIATTGRVRVMVAATNGPIERGDLLVASPIAGVAMKSEPIIISGRQIHQPGTIVGKALEPLAKGRGQILLLLTLQ